MIQIIKELNIEVSKPNVFQAVVAKQYDMNTRFIKATFVDYGEKITIPQSATLKVVINALRNDGLSKGFDGVINDDGTVTVPLHSWMLELVGTVICDISVIDTAEDGEKKLTTTSFTLIVEKAAWGGGDITSDPQYDLLIELLNTCESAGEVAEEALRKSTEANAKYDACVEATRAAEAVATEWQNEIDKTNARLDEMVVARALATSDPYLYEDDHFKVEITTNGAVAYFWVKLSDIVPDGVPVERTFPSMFMPFDEQVVLNHDWGDGVYISLQPHQQGENTILCVINNSGTTLNGNAHATYDLASVMVHEFSDARIGYNGTVYDTLGDAIREPMKAIDARCGDLSAGMHSNSMKIGKLETDASELNEVVFDVEVIPPSKNLYNPNTVTEGTGKNTPSTVLYFSDVIPCVEGDILYVRVKDADGNIASPGSTNQYNRVYSDGTVSSTFPSNSPNYTVPTADGKSLVGVQVGVQIVKIPDGKKESVLVYKNEAPVTGDPFIPYFEGGVVKHNKVEKNRADLQEQINEIDETVEALAKEVELLKEQLTEDDTDLAKDVEELQGAVFEMEVVEPSANLFDHTAVTEGEYFINNNTTFNVWVSEPIPVSIGDTVYVYKRGESVTYRRHYIFQFDEEVLNPSFDPSVMDTSSKGNSHYHCVRTESHSGSYTVTQPSAKPDCTKYIRVGFNTPNNGSSYPITKDELADFMVTFDENQVDFVEYREGGVIKHDKVEKNRAELQEHIDTLTEQTASTEKQMGELSKKVDAVASGTTALPDYWLPHLAEKIARVRELQRAGGKDCYSFISMADYHNPGNIARSPELIKRIADACNIKYCLCLGDIQSGGAYTTKEACVEDWENIHDDFTPIRDMTLFTAGNHDGAWGRFDKDGSGSTSGDTKENYVYNFTRAEIYDYIFRPVSKINGVVFNDTCDAYYVDDTTAKVRYLLMNSQWATDDVDENGCAVNTIMRHGCFGQSQQDFAVKALKSLPDGNWNVVVGCHMPITAFPGDGGGRDLSLFRDMLVAFQNRTTFTGTYGTAGDYNYVSLNVDFTDAVGRVVGAFAGHMHNDLMNTDYAYPIVVHAADNHASFKATGDIAEAGVEGTITEQSFDIVTVDKQKGIMYLTKVGKGADRVASIDPNTCVATLKLDGNCKASNPEQAITKNTAYTNTIMANTAYALSAVTVTMGGVDITATAYANGVITIPNVTGNVGITATTVQLYNNLVDLDSDDCYLESHRLVSGVITTASSGYNKTVIVTNPIPVSNGDVLRFKGLDRDTGVQGSAARMVLYGDADKVLSDIKMPASEGKIPAEDANGVSAYTVSDASARYIRFSAHWLDTAENVIVTVNEEIV